MEHTRRNFLGSMAAAAMAAGAGSAAAAGKSTERPMRRMDRALNKQEIDWLLDHTLHCVLSTTDAAGMPYGVAVSPIRIGDKFYFHCFKGASRKIDNIRQNPNVSMFFIGSDKADEPVFALNFASVIVAGKARIITDIGEIGKIMTALCKFQCPDGPMDYAVKHFADDGKKLIVVEITPTQITGKARKKQRYFRDMMQPQAKSTAGGVHAVQQVTLQNAKGNKILVKSFSNATKTVTVDGKAMEKAAADKFLADSGIQLTVQSNGSITVGTLSGSVKFLSPVGPAM